MIFAPSLMSASSKHQYTGSYRSLAAVFSIRANARDGTSRSKLFLERPSSERVPKECRPRRLVHGSSRRLAVEAQGSSRLGKTYSGKQMHADRKSWLSSFQ